MNKYKFFSQEYDYHTFAALTSNIKRKEPEWDIYEAADENELRKRFEGSKMKTKVHKIVKLD